MSLRALLRSTGFQPLALSTSSRPQFVNDDGYEYDPYLVGAEDEIEGEAQDEDADVKMEEDGEEDPDQVDEAIEDGAEEDAEQEVQEEEDEAGVVEPLTSLADSLVLPFSLTQTRHHHLTSLLPHVFSHPPIPTHSKPRIKPPPKGTFLFPTPAAPEQPLPYPEYHGPTKIPERATTADEAHASPTPGGGGTLEAGPSSSATKSARPTKPRKSTGVDGTEPPAHEIECISRCTLSVGPISFPGTEIWIGRFVEPRTTRKKERAKPGERREREKLRAEERAAKKAARLSAVSRAREEAGRSERPRASLGAQRAALPKSGVGVGTGIGAPVRSPAPRPPQAVPQTSKAPRQPDTSAAPGAPGAPPPRPTASPQLIQLVNHAASRHPWLSALIYKAAGSTANQEELERLGKAVARLSRGEPIEDLAPGYQPPVFTSTSAAPPAAGSSSAGTLTANASSAAGPSTPVSPPAASPTISTMPAPAAPPVSTPTPDDAPSTSTSSSDPEAPSTSTVKPDQDENPDADSDSDGEPDMKGPPQEGGGPLPADMASPSVPIASASASATQSASLSPAPEPSPPAPASRTTITQNPPHAPASLLTHQPLPLTSQSPTPPPPLPSTPIAAPVPHAQSQSPALVTPPPQAAPKPTYPLPPPFLLIAFKETATEKYLLPLGLHSFISRVGGDWVTGPKPEPTAPSSQREPLAQSEEQPTDQPRQATISETKPMVSEGVPINGSVSLAARQQPPAEPSAVPAQPAPARSRGRTRPSLGRGAKDHPPPITPTPAAAASASAAAPAVPEPEPTPQPELDPSVSEKKARPTSSLPPLPGTKPSQGAVLISTFVPADKWNRVNWDPAGRKLPFDNPLYWDKTNNPSGNGEAEVKLEPEESSTASTTPAAPADPTASASAPSPTTPAHRREKRSTRPLAGSTSKSSTSRGTFSAKAARVNDKPRLFNLASEDLMPADGSVQALTIRIEGLDDAAWARFKGVVDEVEKEEIWQMVQREPDMLEAIEAQAIDTTLQLPGSSSVISAVRSHSRLSENALTALRPIYLEKKKSLFSRLLTRTAPRSFLRTRLPPPVPPELLEASTDKWAPRPYPMTTKPLYVVETEDAEDPGEEGLENAYLLPPSPGPEGRGKKRKAPESAVTFEMPESFDALDERVEEGAKVSLSRRGGRGKGRGSLAGTAGGEGGGGEGRKVRNKRGTEKGTCEGCARQGIKVWRVGPGGRGTLCNACGDLFTREELPPLKAPGAMSALNAANAAEDEAAEPDETGKAGDAGADGNDKAEAMDVTAETEKDVEQKDSQVEEGGTTEVVGGEGMEVVGRDGLESIVEADREEGDEAALPVQTEGNGVDPEARSGSEAKVGSGVGVKAASPKLKITSEAIADGDGAEGKVHNSPSEAEAEAGTGMADGTEAAHNMDVDT